MKLLCSFLLLTFFIAPASFADDKKQAKKETPVSEWLKAENALLDELPKANKDVFFVFRNKHGVIRSIEVVHKDISLAVKSCGKENPEMKKEMRSRLKEWEGAVFPVLKEARKFLKRELKEQEAFHVSDYNHVMKLNDKAYAFSESKIEKQPVSSKEACEGLMASMDATEDKLVNVLQSILLPEEVLRKRAEQAKKKS